MPRLLFDNRFVAELPADTRTGPGVREVLGAAYSLVEPTPVPQPRLLAWSHEVGALLGLERPGGVDNRLLEVLAGNQQLPGMQGYAANYGGHQFGHWAGQLGDGRAIGLGEVVNAAGQRWELQLKGAGPTPYSRSADGRAVLRSSVREFLCSEAMHHLGVPTTRALSLLATGQPVVRDMFYDGHAAPEPGAIVCRAAPSFLRFGSFELPAMRGDIALLRKLADFAVDRDFPELEAGDPARHASWFKLVCERTAVMVAHWMRVGFVHGVMNTDNMSILGLTIDYGPYGWIDDYDPDWTPNTTDAQGRRYRFGWQPRVAYWNLTRLAAALAPLFEDTDPLEEGLQAYRETYERSDRDNAAAKLGLSLPGDVASTLMLQLQALLHQGRIDMTLFFRALSMVDPAAPSLQPFEPAFYEPQARAAVAPGLLHWLGEHGTRVLAEDMDSSLRTARMQRVNPRFVLRNYLAQQAIDRAAAGDEAAVEELLEVMRRPYDEQPGNEAYAQRRPEWARDRAGCSMLSCSS